MGARYLLWYSLLFQSCNRNVAHAYWLHLYSHFEFCDVPLKPHLCRVFWRPAQTHWISWRAFLLWIKIQSKLLIKSPRMRVLRSTTQNKKAWSNQVIGSTRSRSWKICRISLRWYEVHTAHVQSVSVTFMMLPVTFWLIFIACNIITGCKWGWTLIFL